MGEDVGAQPPLYELAGRGPSEIALEDERAGKAVGEIIVADGGDGDVDLDRIDPGAEEAGGGAAGEEGAYPGDKRLVDVAKALG